MNAKMCVIVALDFVKAHCPRKMILLISKLKVCFCYFCNYSEFMRGSNYQCNLDCSNFTIKKCFHQKTMIFNTKSNTKKNPNVLSSA